MKKQFFRVKQLADQTFSRAGKTELLSDDLQEIDRHVEFLKNACTNANKKLSLCLLGQGSDDSSKEKRYKKCAEYHLGQALKDSSLCDDDFTLKHILGKCGDTEITLAHEYIKMDMALEEDIVNPLQYVIDNDIPSIMKHKRNLAKLTLDMDAARTRYQTAVKHSANSNTTGTKIDAIREEMEEAQSKVEQSRDLLVTEMYQLISKEAEIAKYIAQIISIRKSYHESALNLLTSMEGELSSDLKNNIQRPVFGETLEEHLRVNNRKIAYPLEVCVCTLLVLGMDEEGLFRVAGGASKVRRMRMSLDSNCLTFEAALNYSDPAVIAGALKSYLREMPDPLMTHKLYNHWMNAASRAHPEERIKGFKEVIDLLPESHRDNLKYLIKFFAALCRNQDVNKMTPQNIAIVIAPNLIWNQQDAKNTIGLNMSTANVHSFIVDTLVTHADDLFPGETEFFVTIPKPDPVELGTNVRQTNGSKSSSSEKGHSRNSSADTLLINNSPDPGAIKRTQSNSSLTDQSSPPQSPKPVLRRKNKLAPNPPQNQTIKEKVEKPPRPLHSPLTKVLQFEKVRVEEIKEVPKELPKEMPREKPPVLKEPPSPKELPKEMLREKPPVLKEPPSPKESTPPVPAPKPTQRHSGDPTAPPEVAEKPTVAQKPRFPVAAPRTIMADSPTEKKAPEERPKPVVPERPVIPERPASLKESFKARSSDSLEEATPKLLEPSSPLPQGASNIELVPENKKMSDHLSASESTDDELLEPDRTGKGGSFRNSKLIARPTPPPPPPPTKPPPNMLASAESTDL